MTKGFDSAFAGRLTRRHVLIGAGALAGTGVLGLDALAASTGAGGATKLSLAWNASAICTAAAPVAKERGIFAKHKLDVEFVNFGSSTEQLLEAIATGKADAGVGMALRWLKPLEQGFDVKITAGVHGGCLRLIGSKSAGTTSIQSLKGKTIAVADMGSPGKNFFSIFLAKNGIDPEKDVQWRVYPGELLPAAVEKGEAQALTDNDPRTWLFLKDKNLVEIATNMSGEYARRTCCILGVRGSLIRENKAVAAALTRAVLEAGHLVAHKPADAAAIFADYGGKGTVQELTAMLESHGHQDQILGSDLEGQIAAYAEELKQVNVFKANTDVAKYAKRVHANVLG